MVGEITGDVCVYPSASMPAGISPYCRISMEAGSREPSVFAVGAQGKAAAGFFLVASFPDSRSRDFCARLISGRD